MVVNVISSSSKRLPIDLKQLNFFDLGFEDVQSRLDGQAFGGV